MFKFKSCAEVSKLVSDGLDRKLSLWDRISVFIHFQICKPCVNYKKQLGFLRDALTSDKNKAVEQSDTKLEQQARDRIREKLSKEISS